MPETPRLLAPVHASIFVKLLGIMVVMAVCLLALVAGFFGFVVNPGVGEAIGHVLEAYGDEVAARSPDLDEARRVAEPLGIRIEYRGPKGAWSTVDGPLAGTAHAGDLPGPFSSWTRSRRLVRAPDGGTYSFSWAFGRSISAAHDKLVWLLLLVMTLVIVTAHEVLRRALRPVRLLYAGVARVAEGDLEVEVPRQSRDELGVLTDAFNQMTRRVKEMIASRDQLLLDVSHELRSPLTRLKVALALVPEGEKRAQMEADVAEMEAMITGLLEMERLRDGRGVRLERRDLMPIVREIAEQFRDTPPGVRVSAPAGAILLDLDGERIRTLLRNVIENAVKYALPDSRPVEVTVEERADAVVVRVDDDGPGIAEADLGRIFEPFYRADRSRSKRTGGYGLGLSMCKRIMEAHGGTIAAENRPGRGTSIVLTFRSRSLPA